MVQFDLSLSKESKLEIDIGALELRYSKDSIFLAQMLKRFTITYTDCLQLLREAALKSDLLAMGRIAHKLKGSALNYARNDLTEWLQMIEEQGMKSQPIVITNAEIDLLKFLFDKLCAALDEISKDWKSASTKI